MFSWPPGLNNSLVSLQSSLSSLCLYSLFLVARSFFILIIRLNASALNANTPLMASMSVFVLPGTPTYNNTTQWTLSGRRLSYVAEEEGPSPFRHWVQNSGVSLGKTLRCRNSHSGQVSTLCTRCTTCESTDWIWDTARILLLCMWWERTVTASIKTFLADSLCTKT